MDMPNIIESHEWRWVFISGAVLLILLTAPFVWVYGVGAPEATFTGVLVNPIDGASYQAKMFQGQSGSWLFRLPYTPEPHDGVFVYTFYLGMGHLARLLNVQPILVFHAFRLIGAMLMFLALYRFVADWTSNVAQRRVTWTLGVLGAGFGWIALLFEHITPDLLVLPEAFPFQAAYTNTHFPWAIALALLTAHILLNKSLLGDPAQPGFDIQTAALVAATLILVSAAPFVLLPIGIGYGLLLAWLWQHHRAFPRRQIAWGMVVLISGAPVAAYNIWAVSAANPVFAAWMAQNLTPSPPVWDYLIAFGPLLALAAAGLWGSRQRLGPEDIFLLGWLLSAFLLLYAPLGLQRRFAMALTAPLAVYAARGLWRVVLPAVGERWKLPAIAAVYALFMPTTLAALLLPMFGSFGLLEQGGGPYFLLQEERQTLDWLGREEPEALVLASPEMGLFLPTHGLRVVYGHPFETLRAEERRQAVNAFYSGADCSVAAAEGVDLILVGPRERQIGGEAGMCPLPETVVYRSPSGEIAVYDARGD